MKSGTTVVIVLVSSLLMVFISASPALALWSSNPSVNTPVITNGAILMGTTYI